MPKPGKGVPDGHHTITPYLACHDANKAIAFYKKAFGAEELARMPAPDGKRVMHAELKIGNSMLMLADSFPEHGGRAFAEGQFSPASMCLYVTDCDALFKRAVDAGAKVIMPPTDQFWGDRMAKVNDNMGYDWAISTQKFILTPEEMKAAMPADCGGAGKAGAK